MIVSVDIPTSVLSDLQEIAQAEGFASPKALVTHWLKEKVKAARRAKAALAVEGGLDLADLDEVA